MVQTSVGSGYISIIRADWSSVVVYACLLIVFFCILADDETCPLFGVATFAG